MLTTNNEAWAKRARTLREHAMGVSAAERHSALVAPAESYAEVGYNFRMTDLQAAMGLVQLGKARPNGRPTPSAHRNLQGCARRGRRAAVGCRPGARDLELPVLLA